MVRAIHTSAVPDVPLVLLLAIPLVPLVFRSLAVAACPRAGAGGAVQGRCVLVPPVGFLVGQ